MSKKLQIVVTHCNETLAEVRPLLDSIDIQQNVNFDDIGVIVVNDGGNSLKGALPEYQFETEHIDIEKAGVSAARNAGLDAVTADYVMFCDCDDMFANVCGLWIVMREIEKGFDLFISSFIEETRDRTNGSVVYINHDFDLTFVHGKVHSVRFLKKNGIRWNPDLTVHEDSFFHLLAQRLSSDTKHCPTPFYLWKWRDGSVCRRDPLYMLKTYRDLIKSSAALVRELSSRGRLDAAAEVVVQMTYDSYFTMNKEEWLNQDNQQYRVDTERAFAAYRREFTILYNSVQKETRDRLVMGIKNRMFSEGVVLEKITFDDWIRRVEALEDKP